ncbi:hypothetical protein, conserved [Angomonas deanei]|uniref:Reverse transcriptase domain-containing protein n=1 Tax=Angomonas deanei TaxID=59799 RepID=A0A7G2CRW0_9TRYP|nr:hypothetical protein, conserved [Angomonas deanei]
MLQIDFNSYYDAIPLEDSVRNNFVFRGKDGQYYRLRTLPTGARWSVCVGQAITSTIVDIDVSQVVILSLIDNILIAAPQGSEGEFLFAVRSILTRIQQVHLETSPDRDTLLQTGDQDLLRMAEQSDVFLGEEYRYEPNEYVRKVRNSIKTVAKLRIAMRKAPYYTCRQFVRFVSLILFAAHTVNLNPASLFFLLKAYRAVYVTVCNTGGEWDAPLPHISPRVYEHLQRTTSVLAANEYAPIAPVIRVTAEDRDYDWVIYTDASDRGWGAICQNTHTQEVIALQKEWMDELQCGTYRGPTDEYQAFLFNKKHSAHAEPRAAREVLEYLKEIGRLVAGMRVALVTDHEAIVRAQRKLNGFGGIGRGTDLNLLYEMVYNWFHWDHLLVLFFYLPGPQNPADQLSRVIDSSNCGEIRRVQLNGRQLPTLRNCYCPLLEREVESILWG